jgi:hypothetical protein
VSDLRPDHDHPGRDFWGRVRPVPSHPGEAFHPGQRGTGANQPVGDHPALRELLGHWRGSTHLAAGPWGPERVVEAEVTYRRVAGGTGVVQSYGHRELDGQHFQGHGMFTVDPDHQDVLWYYVDSTEADTTRADAPARCTWHNGVLRVERHGSAGWTRHTLRVDGDVLTHVTELRRWDPFGVHSEVGTGKGGAGADGTGSAYTPLMTSTFSRK